jgi:hypothetical protein
MATLTDWEFFLSGEQFNWNYRRLRRIEDPTSGVT